jgi:hypothetical protein
VRNPGGGWKKASNSIDYSDEWQVLNRNPFAWDIAQEDPNTSFDPVGQTENLDYPKWSGVRHAGKTSLYPDDDLPGVTDANGDRAFIRSLTRSRTWMQTATGASTGPTRMGMASTMWEKRARRSRTRVSIRRIPRIRPPRGDMAMGRYNMGDPVART